MNIQELVSAAKQSSSAIADLPDGKARALVRSVFDQILKEVEAAGEEPVRVTGLGLFKTRELQKEGQPEKIKRTIFRPAILKKS